MEEPDDLHELHELVRAVTTVVLDDETIPSWSVSSGQYYAKLTQHICAYDDRLVQDIQNIATYIRSTYRSFIEYSNRVAAVDVTRSSTLDECELCCVCLQKLDGNWQRVVRLRSIDSDPAKCGHRIHKSCAMKLHGSDDGCVHCPLCRETLGPHQWFDTESKIPRF